MAKLEGLAHVGLFIMDLERSKAFYRDILDFNVIYECENEDADGSVAKIAFIQNGNLVIELVEFENPQAKGDGIVDHIAIAVEDIEEVKKMLAGRGITFESGETAFGKTVFPNGTKWVMFRGPDGEHLELNEIMPY